eukprot:TRINITY_DN3340_c0_g1_i2.p1 TRINITY_DN3340_c0_g1~~TRINITY_DN3340_c0_g1_i2.p1  ORF type:complete len:476 (-),score=61.94 TRINITY_DN3340_c0_g1_i2:41-1468(-)
MSSEEAERLKTEANKFFEQKKYKEAVASYSQAIDACPTAILFSNRSFAHIKMENFGSAIEDANKAVSLDSNYIKGYYRLGAAYMALGKPRDALKNFRQVVKIVPNDRDARTKLLECEKQIKKMAFEEAIASEHTKSVFEEVSYQDTQVDESYTGPSYEGDKISKEFASHLVQHFKDQKNLHKRYVYRVLSEIYKLLLATPTLVEIPRPKEEGGKFTVCGDVHGQFYDLCNIFTLNGEPSEDNPYLFNGDFVDRGSFSVEVILTLLTYKLVYPNHFHLARGNHESKSMNKMYGFEGEVKAKYGEVAMSMFSEIFCLLPLAHVIGEKVLVVHGGLFSKDGVTLDDIKKINRNCEPPDSGLMSEILWSDPQAFPGRSPSKRGVGLSFGPDVTQRFLEHNGLELVIRSHEVKDEGYQFEHNGKLITLFSAPNYCDQVGNKGAFLILRHDLKPNLTSFEAVPHPNVRPMAYASNFNMFGL